MDQERFGELRSAARAAARRLAKPGVVDSCARDQDDYASILTMKALQAHELAADRGWDTDSSRRYMFKSLRHCACDLHRQRSRTGARDDATREQVQYLDDHTTPQPDDRLAALETLCVLKENLSSSDWQVVEALGLSSGSIMEAREVADLDVSLPTFGRRVRRLRQRARVIVEAAFGEKGDFRIG